MEKKLITLKLVDFNDTETETLVSILTLAERNLSARWKITESDAQANFFIFSQKYSSQKNNPTFLKNHSVEQCVFCVLETKDALKDKNCLPVTDSGFFSLTALIELLNQLAQQKPVNKKTENVPVNKPPENIPITKKAESIVLKPVKETPIIEEMEEVSVNKPAEKLPVTKKVENEVVKPVKKTPIITKVKEVVVNKPIEKLSVNETTEKIEKTEKIENTPAIKPIEKSSVNKVIQEKPIIEKQPIIEKELQIGESTEEEALSETNLESLPPEVKEKIDDLVSDLYFDYSKSFLDILLNASFDLFVISLTNEPAAAPIYINMIEEKYYCPDKLIELERYVITAAALSIMPCSIIELGTANLKALPLNDLIWYAALKASDGKVIKGHMPNQIVKLKKWPNLGLPHCLDYARLATFMKNNATTLQVVSKRTKIPLVEIYPFYNACYLAGLIDTEIKADVKEKKIDAKRLSLLAQIETRLDINND